MAGKLSFSKRELNILLVLAGILISFGGYRYGYVPFQDKVRTMDSKIQSAQTLLARNVKIREQASRFNKKNQTLLETAMQQGSDEKIMSRMLSDIERVAREVGIRVADLKPRKVKKRDLYSHFSVSLVIEGDVTDILRFIHSLQGPTCGFNVDEMQIRRRSLRIKDLRCQIVLSSLFVPPGSGMGG